jgi:hypothetical protein
MIELAIPDTLFNSLYASELESGARIATIALHVSDADRAGIEAKFRATVLI